MRATLAFNWLILSIEDQVNKAEVQALHVVNKNLSFASTLDDGNRFRTMFPNSIIPKSHRMSDTKEQYLNLIRSCLTKLQSSEKTVRRVLVILVKSPQQSSQFICWLFVCRSL